MTLKTWPGGDVGHCARRRDAQLGSSRSRHTTSTRACRSASTRSAFEDDRQRRRPGRCRRGTYDNTSPNGQATTVEIPPATSTVSWTHDEAAGCSS